jgi:hypothetical protein
MKFAALSSVAVAATAVLAIGTLPALALPNYDGDYYNTPVTTMAPPVTVVTTAPPADVQSEDQARQDYYQNKLDAAQAQARADDAMAKADEANSERDQALADRDAAQDRAYDHRVIEDEDRTDDAP